MQVKTVNLLEDRRLFLKSRYRLVHLWVPERVLHVQSES
jgi:hypothetical protein